MIAVFIFTVVPSYSEISENSDSVINQKGVAVNELTFTQTGNQIDDHKLGFLPPTEFTEQPEDFKGWLLFYTTKDIESTWTVVKGYSNDMIEDYADTAGENRMYQVTNYGWADGIGNTMRSGQKELLTGKDFGPGEYHFYVATYADDGIIGLAEANQVINIKPSPKNVKLHGDGDDINEYAVSFESYNDSRIINNFIFYSSKRLYETREEILSLSPDIFEKLAKKNRGVLLKNLKGTFKLPKQLKTLQGEAFTKKNYYVYVVALGEEEVLGISWSKRILINDKIPKPATKKLNNGIGTILTAGGHTSTSDADSVDFYEEIRQRAGGGRPKIAIFSSSRDNYETVFNHFYFDDPTYGALKDNFHNLGFKPVFIPVSIDTIEYYANNDYYANLIKSCDAVFLQGGDQNKHIRSLLNDDGSESKLLKAIQYVYNRGGIVAGTSAGMAAMGEYAYGYGTPIVAIGENTTEHYDVIDIPTSGDLFPAIDNNNLTVPGIGLVPESVLTDTHFDARGRLGRLVVAMRDTAKTIGIGADEGTGLAIRSNIGKVIGHHGITIVDSSEAKFSETSDTNFSVMNLKIHYLTEGDAFDFNTRTVIPAQNKEKITFMKGGDLNQGIQVFDGDYAFTKAMLDFVNHSDIEVKHTIDSSQLPFHHVILKKINKTLSYSSNESYLDSLLEDYNKSTVSNLMMDIQYEATTDLEGPIITGYDQSTPYTVYFLIEDLSGIDASTVNQDNIVLISDSNKMYEDSPVYNAEYGDIKISIATNDYVSGDIITFDGIQDTLGNTIESQSWRFDGSDWIKMDTVLDVKAPVISGINMYSKAYSSYIGIMDHLSGIDVSSINQETVKVISAVNTIYETSPKYDPDYDEIKVSINEDTYISGDEIHIEGIRDLDGNTMDLKKFRYNGKSWDLIE